MADLTDTSTSSNPPPAPAPAAPPSTGPADAYDVGGDPPSAPSPGTASPQADASAAPGNPAPPAPADSLDRRPDGTFLPKSHRHPKALVEMARDFGMAPDDIAGADTEALSMTLRYLQQGARREQSVQQTIAGAMDEGAPAGATPGGGAATPPDPADTFDPPTAAEGYDPKIVKLGELVSRLLAENAALQSQVGQVTGHLASEASKTYTERCDAWFGKLPDLFGKGSYEELGKDSPELARRSLIAAEAKKHKGGTLEDRLEKARALVYGAAPASPAAVKGPTPDEWRQGGVAVPTQRSGAAEPPSRDRAIQTVRAYLDQQAAASKDVPATLAEEFPV